MSIDPTIPLQGNPQPDFFAQQRNMLSLRDMALRFRQEQAASQAQNALRQIFANPANLDEKTGFPTSNAMNQIMAIDPNTGMQLRQNQLRSEQLNLSIAGSKADLQQKLSSMSEDMVRSPSLIAYEDAKKAGLSEQDAQAAGQRAYSDGLQQLKATGLASADQMAVVPSDFNYGRVKQKSMAYKDYLARQAAEKKEALEERKTEVAEKREATFEKSVTSQISARDQTKFTDKMGDLMGALAEQGVSLPTGFRSKAQQVQLYQSLLDRHPDMSAEEIAKQIKTGQIEFAAQKKETQTAAGIAGRVEVAQNELAEFVPLVRSASAKVDRTRFIPINRLLQMGESEISDPNLKQLRIYINSTLNAYDVLAARGGTDKDKRAESRALLTSADGPEALEAGLTAFEKEAEAARRAAIKATKVPELPEQGGSPKPAAPSGADDIKKQATAAWGSYEPDKYDYRVNPATGRLQRSPK